MACSLILRGVDDSARRGSAQASAGPVTEKFILENRLAELGDYIANGEAGMQTFDQHLLALYREQAISGTEALRWASSPESLAMGLRGITRIGSGRKT